MWFFFCCTCTYSRHSCEIHTSTFHRALVTITNTKVERGQLVEWECLILSIIAIIIYRKLLKEKVSSYSMSFLQMISPFNDISFSVLNIAPGSIQDKRQKTQKGTFFLGLSLLTNIYVSFYFRISLSMQSLK